MSKRKILSQSKRNIIICTILLGCVLIGCKHNTNIEKTQNQEVALNEYKEQQDASEEEHENPESVYMVVENPSFEYYFEGEDLHNEQTIALHELETRKNEIIDTEGWFEKNGLEKPGFPYSDGTYTYQTIGEQYEAMTDNILQIVDEA